MKPLFTTSWDDGHPLDFRVAEMLSHHGLTGTFYIPRTAPTGVMSEQQIRQLSRSYEIGAHTINHVFLTEAPPGIADEEITSSRAWVENITGIPCKMFCPPAGKFNANHLDMIKSAGFLGLRTVELYSLDAPRHQNGLLLMPTTLQSHPHKPLALIKNAIKRFNLKNLWRYIRHGNAADWPKAASALIQLTQKQNAVFHLWGHTWELEEAAQWTRLNQVFEMMSRCTPQIACVTNTAVCETVSQVAVGGTTSTSVIDAARPHRSQ